jgi:putative PIN family toxin of toxin-antitoxin system
MPKAVLDTTVLVSAFLRHSPGGVSYELLRLAGTGAYELYLSDDILEETAAVLLREGRLRQRYLYTDKEVIEYCQDLGRLATIVNVLAVEPIVRDPNDDMIVACALAAGADYLVTRDKDMLSIGNHQGIAILTPEAFAHVLRKP